jgi:hypothetical protein
MVQALDADQLISTFLGGLVAAVAGFLVAVYTIKGTKQADLQVEQRRESYRAAADLHASVLDTWDTVHAWDGAAGGRRDVVVAVEQLRRDFLVHRSAITEPELRKQGWRTYDALRAVAAEPDGTGAPVDLTALKRIADQQVQRLGQDLAHHRLGRSIDGRDRGPGRVRPEERSARPHAEAP